MAKSIRSKAKMASRARKRQQSHYAIADAARTQRLSDKLLGKDKPAGEAEETMEQDTEMQEDPKKISTSGWRGSRKEQWRTSKGLSVKPKRSVKGLPNGSGDGNGCKTGSVV
ncbi:uncharacterized protein L203_101785 [Cryptococcus depauperatus CBS 7841]|uniref:DUF2423 domain-containing protein n=1 Tax=Cryptococcus depauperatus CBS 7841 TaxID=1295531 RepID=A0AAJ8JQI2_9TREE